MILVGISCGVFLFRAFHTGDVYAILIDSRVLMPCPTQSKTVSCSTLCKYCYYKKNLKSVALARKRTIPTERPPLVGEVSANFCG
jgi:hypothetical protein